MTDKLKALALAAKAEDADQSWYSPDDLLTGVIDREADAAYIAAASPDVVLALIADLENERRKVTELVDGYEKDQAELKQLRAEVEQLRVQLAGCGVAAMGNTEDSKAERIERGAYGWSESYGDVCRAVDREIELRAEVERLKELNEDLYRSAIANLAERDALRAELARLKAQEPVAWGMKKNGLILDIIHPDEHESHEGDYTIPLYLASGAAQTSKTIDVKWHHDLAQKETDRESK